MEIILRHLEGPEQHRFLQMFLEGVIQDPVRKAQVIQKIMEDINNK